MVRANGLDVKTAPASHDSHSLAIIGTNSFSLSLSLIYPVEARNRPMRQNHYMPNWARGWSAALPAFYHRQTAALPIPSIKPLLSASPLTRQPDISPPENARRRYVAYPHGGAMRMCDQLDRWLPVSFF
jgi:hypothetical protein